MYVCVCKAVSDRSVRSMSAAGTVMSLRDLARSTGAGTCCGKCVPELRQMLSASVPAVAGTVRSASAAPALQAAAPRGPRRGAWAMHAV